MRKKPAQLFLKEKYFEGCMPIEVMAKRGIVNYALWSYGNQSIQMTTKDPWWGVKTPYAVQLRQDAAASLQYRWFPNHLNGGEQSGFSNDSRFGNAEFVRYGVMHRNSYMDFQICLNKPTVLRKRLISSLQVKWQG